MNKFIIKAALTLVLFLFIYNPPVKFLPMNMGIVIGGCFFILYLFELLIKIGLSKKIQINKHLLQVVILVSFIVLYSLLVAIISGSRDLQMFKSYLSFLLFYLPGSFGIVQLLKKYYSGIGILKILVLITVIQSVIILTMFVNPGIKEFLFSLLRDESERTRRNLSSGGFRFLGFSFGTTWDLSIVQSIGILSIALLLKIDKTQLNIKNSLYFLLLAVSIFLTGRSGIFGILLALFIIIIPNKINEIPFGQLLKFGGRIFLVAFLLFFILKSFIPVRILNIVETKVLPWAFEMFQNYNGGDFETTSSNDLKAMYFLPPIKTLLIGDGYYVNQYDNTRYYMDIDAGYMRHIFFYGIIGCLMVIVLYTLVFYQMLKFSNAVSKSPAVKIYITLLCIYTFILHLKGDVLAGSDMPIKSIFILYATFILLKKPKELPDSAGGL